MKKRFRRRRKLIKPAFQLRLVLSFVGLSVLGQVLLFLLLGSRLTQVISTLPEDGGELAHEVPAMLLTTFGLSLAILVPVTVVFGVLLTFRVAGPIHRFESHLISLARGEEPGPCRIRKGDELQFLCDAINEATGRLQTQRGEPAAALAEESSAEQRAA